MNGGGPSGFNNAPVTKTIVITSAVFSFFFGIRGLPKIDFSYQNVFVKPQMWKLIMSKFAFSSTPELMFGLYLLYYFRVFERQIGSNKYCVFVIFSGIVSFLFEVLGVALIKDPTSKLAPGPYGLIFASFVPFFFDIPISTRFRVFNVSFSDKSFIYLAGLQLLLSSWKRSIFPGACGILAGCLYHLNLFGIRKAKFPEFITSRISQLSLWSTGSPRGATRNVGSFTSNVSRRVEGTHHAPASAPRAPSLEPPEDSIAMLVSMGFDRNSARQALVSARNDINAATNILLEAQSH